MKHGRQGLGGYKRFRISYTVEGEGAVDIAANSIEEAFQAWRDRTDLIGEADVEIHLDTENSYELTAENLQ